MKKVSAKLFFTVLWRGVCQAVAFLLSPFGYKRDGKFAKVVWGVFATSSAIIMAFFAIVIVSLAGNWLYRRFLKTHSCKDDYCFHSNYVNRDIYYHDSNDGKGYVYNKRSGEKMIKNVEWIAMPATSKDTLVCYSDGKKRGYFSKNTGKVVVEPKYNHAWVFSEGLASVEEGGFIKFIDGTGKVVIDNKMAYNPDKEGYVFHDGYCIVDTDDDEQHGLMDKTGKLVLPMEYSYICSISDYKLWHVIKGDEAAVLDKEMKTVVPFMECSLYVDEGTIDVTMTSDHTMRKYDLQGNLLGDFYISNVRTLDYETDEIRYQTAEYGDMDNTTLVEAPYHPKATARLRAYVAGDGYEGLMTADGHVVVMPLYKDIDALGYDLYICTSTNYDRVIVNGKGEIVR